VSDNLIADIAEGSRIFVPTSSMGLKAFSIECLIELEGIKRRLTLGRPFAGVDDRLWGVLGAPMRDMRSLGEMVELEIACLSFKISKLVSDYAQVNGLCSIDELKLTAPDGRRLRIFGDVDDFEVPCINCELVGR
jgi:hypothetical protein